MCGGGCGLQANPYARNKKDQTILELCKNEEMKDVVNSAIQEQKEAKVRCTCVAAMWAGQGSLRSALQFAKPRLEVQAWYETAIVML